jgi:hypothetical protein
MSMLEVLGAASATGKTTYGRTPIYQMRISGSALEVNVQSATINMGEDMHDTITMTVSSADRTTTEGLVDQTISFLYGNSGKTEVFSGFITEVAEQQNSTGVLTWSMSIVGPTKPMQTGVPRFWTNRSIPSAIESLAYWSYLGYYGHDHTFIWKTLAQTDISDWKMAVSLARRLGWAVYNRYGVVMLLDPLQLFLNQGAVATLISETYTLAKNSFNDERTLLEFSPQEESETSPSQMGIKAAYFNADTVQVAMQQGVHTNYRFVNNFVIRGPEEAALYVDAIAHDSSNWRHTATARIMGNAALFPGMSVDVLTKSSGVAAGKFNGRWLIRSVQHKMDKQSFQSNLTMARPEGKMMTYSGGYSPFWGSTTRPRPTLTYMAETGSWMSSWTNSIAREVK